MKQPKASNQSSYGYLQELEFKERKHSRIRFLQTGLLLSLTGLGGITALLTLESGPLTSTSPNEARTLYTAESVKSPHEVFPNVASEVMIPYVGSLEEVTIEGRVDELKQDNIEEKKASPSIQPKQPQAQEEDTVKPQTKQENPSIPASLSRAVNPSKAPSEENYQADSQTNALEKPAPRKEREKKPSALTFHNTKPINSTSPTLQLSDMKAPEAPVDHPKAKLVPVADIPPVFQGGRSAMIRFINKRLNYPRNAITDGIEGKVFVRFVVEADGRISQPNIIKGIGHGCDEEALRVVQRMPAWQPGKVKGEAVRTYAIVAIQFKLAN